MQDGNSIFSTEAGSDHKEIEDCKIKGSFSELEIDFLQDQLANVCAEQVL